MPIKRDWQWEVTQDITALHTVCWTLYFTSVIYHNQTTWVTNITTEKRDEKCQADSQVFIAVIQM